jgi:dTDP-4-amino-4,6-dideoxygalactose transaminase
VTEPTENEQPKVPLLDLGPYHRRIRGDVLGAFERVYDSGVFICGPELSAFEKELAQQLDACHVVGVSSGTDALCASLLALGVDADSEVVTTPFTFFASASAIRAAGARIRFADIESGGFGIDPAAVERALGSATRAVLCVHLFGQPCRVQELAELCRGRDVALVEDAAQALGARVGGRAVGLFGRLGCFSFFPSKVLGALGDGGAVVTDEAALADRLRRVRTHGSAHKHEHVEHGGNFRLDELQAAVLRVKLEHLRARIQSNREHAAYYASALCDVASLVVPDWAPGASHSLYTLRVLERRDELAAALAQKGIETRVHYPTPLHLQPALIALGHARGDFPEAERRAEEALSIPLYPELGPRERERVALAIRAFYE